jgi:hypothetical protein
MAVTGKLALGERVEYFLLALNPVEKIGHFTLMADRMAEAALNQYSADEAGLILFFGLLSVIPVKFFSMMGFFSVPFLYVFAKESVKTVLSRWQPLCWAFLFYAFALLTFLTHLFFLTGRYVSFLNLLAVPLVAGGLVALIDRFPRWRMVVIGLALLVGLSNVVSFGAKKTQYVEAGKWLAVNVAERERVYVEDTRVAYYAGWSYRQALMSVMSRDDLHAALIAKRFDMAVLNVRKSDEMFDRWITTTGAREVQRFANARGDAVVIVRAP